MYPPDDKFIRRLHLAENHFLELLLTRFTLQRTGKGTELQISFNDQTPAITQRQAKHAVLGASTITKTGPRPCKGNWKRS